MFRRIFASLITAAAALTFANTANAATFEVMHHFQGGDDGQYPIDRTLSAGADGGIYGISNLFVKQGQTYSRVIWRVRGGAYEVVERFLYGDYEKGFRPAGKMVIDAEGRVYGVTTQGGPQYNGMTFVLEPGKPRRYFQHYIQSPENGLVRDESTGIFYGGGLRVIYQIDPDFTAVTRIASVPRDGEPAPFSVEPGKLHGSFYEDSPFMFTMDLNRGDLQAISPKHGISHTGTTPDGMGNYWGVALGDWPLANYRRGHIYRVDARGNYKIMYRFERDTASSPLGELVARNGKLYGMTKWGPDKTFTGTIFEVDPVNLTYTTIHEFKRDHSLEGQYPNNLQVDPQGNLIGTTASGGTYGYGVIFRISE